MRVKFIGTRTDATTPFWWDAVDSEIQNYNSTLSALADQAGIGHSYELAADGLSYTQEYGPLADLEVWQAFMAQISAAMPGLSAAKEAYFTQASHGQTVEFWGEAGELRQTVQVFPKP